MSSVKQPDWHAAAQALVDGYQALVSSDERVQLTEQLCDKLGGQLYPAYLQILYNVEHFADLEARNLVTGTLTYGLSTGRLPSGKVAAWGGRNLNPSSSYNGSRTLGPIEYVCSWYTQSSHLHPLTRNRFVDIASSLVRLISTDQNATALYCLQLKTDAEDMIGGTLSSKTRDGLVAMSDAWQGGADAVEVVSCYLAGSSQHSFMDQLSIKLPD